MDITVDCFEVDFKDDTFNTPKILTGCSVCAEDHETEKCAIFDNLNHVPDSTVLPRALLTLPPNLRVESLSDGTKTVIATKAFPKGTRFGPYQAEKYYSLNPFDNFPIKIFGNSENILPDYYLDSRNKEKCNWMSYIAPASNFEEQNLILYQIKLEIFYSVIRDIKPGEHLRVWYSSYYASRIGSQVHLPNKEDEVKVDPLDFEKNQQIAETLPAKKLGAEDRRQWCCKMCGYNEENVVKYAIHLQKHYLKMIKTAFVCNICNGGFQSERALKLHRKIVHTVLTDHKPSDIENFIDKSDQSKSDLEDPRLPSPLPIDNLLQAESDQMLMLDHFGIPTSSIYNDLSDAETLQAILCDDNTKASKTAQEKSIADFSLELVESNDVLPKLQPPYFCDICDKLFNTLPYLYRHLKKHAGIFTCVQCLVVFTRQENYLRHPCFTANSLREYKCSYCTKSFHQRKYLIRHIQGHLGKYVCTKCGNQYKAKYDRDNHNCSSVSASQKNSYPCDHCGRKFVLEVYLQRHIKRVHTKQYIKKQEQPVICEICSKVYRTAHALRIHKKLHSEPEHECRTCGKKFRRPDILKIHLLSHGSQTEICDICNKKFKTKAGLNEHRIVHSTIRFSCEHCEKKYTRRKGLLEHQKKAHLEDPVNCQDCGKKFKNNVVYMEHRRQVHTSASFECKTCDKSFTLSRLLTRHEKLYHSDNVHYCPYCPKTFKVRYSLRPHFKKSHLEYQHEWDKPNHNLDETHNDITIKEKTIIKEDKDFIIKDEILTKDNTEILLRLPETHEKAGKSLVILENGTIKTVIKTAKIQNNGVPKTNLDSLISEPVDRSKKPKILSNILIRNAEVDNICKNKNIASVQNVPGNINSLSTSGTDQQINIGKNAFMIEDGTFVQPEDQGNVMFYILNQQLNDS